VPAHRRWPPRSSRLIGRCGPSSLALRSPRWSASLSATRQNESTSRGRSDNKPDLTASAGARYPSNALTPAQSVSVSGRLSPEAHANGQRMGSSIAPSRPGREHQACPWCSRACLQESESPLLNRGALRWPGYQPATVPPSCLDCDFLTRDPAILRSCQPSAPKSGPADRVRGGPDPTRQARTRGRTSSCFTHPVAPAAAHASSAVVAA
jgi:hypothetical protein